MDTEAFLARIIQGNYLILFWISSGGAVTSRAWQADAAGFKDAAAFALGLAKNGCDAYHAVASWKDATQRSNGTFTAVRRKHNAQQIRVFVLDADVKRDGDGKDPAKVFPDQAAAKKWMGEFCTSCKMPLPNLAVSSGYGIHWYWVFEEAQPVSWWSRYAYALKAAAVEKGWTGDTGPTIDVTRVLRPPGTSNFKAGRDHPMPVMIIPEYTAADYPIAVLDAALKPYVNAGLSAAVGAAVAAAGGGGATVHVLGPKPEHIESGAAASPVLNPGAHAGVERPERFFAEIAKKCPQTQQSLAVGGDGDDRNLWFRFLNLAHFCNDGPEYAHLISKGDPRYTEAEVDRELARIAREQENKGFGAPRCARFNQDRPNVCPNCPHWGKINSPIGLGVPGVDGDLPQGYRRNTETHAIEFRGEKDWVRLISGDVLLPEAHELPAGGFDLRFDYVLGGVTKRIEFHQCDAAEPQTVFRALEKQGLAVSVSLIKRMIEFCMAWINDLRRMCEVRRDGARPFGWNLDERQQRMGLAIAGDHYLADGREEAVPGGEATLCAAYRPAGTLDAWRRAAALFENRRPDLQTIVAASFASPLFAFAGEVRGMSINFWSTESGVGKTSALRVGQTVWGHINYVSSLNDTSNAATKLLDGPRILTRYWDELRIANDREHIIAFTDLIYNMPQGRQKARMRSDTSLRETGDWTCLLAITSNRSFVDVLIANTTGTNSGVHRLFEVQLDKEQHNYAPDVGRSLQLLETNYGHAGRVFAQYLATHIPDVERTMTQVMDKLNAQLNFQAEERFFVTVMTTIIAGAVIAKHLKLFDFDIPGLWDCLKKSFMVMRRHLHEHTFLAPGGGYRVRDIIAEFMNENADYRIRTDKFSSNAAKRIRVMARPARAEMRYQIAESETPPTVRLVRSAFYKWLRAKGLSPNEVTQQIRRDLGVGEPSKRSVGGGTREYPSAQFYCIDVPLTGSLASAVDDLGVGESAETA